MPAHNIPITLLFSQSTTAEGKFYIGVLHPQAFFALHGANTPRSAGTLTTKPTLQAMAKVVRTKANGEYAPVPQGRISPAALEHAAQEAARRLNLSPSSPWRISPDGQTLYLGDNSSASSPAGSGGGAQAPRPRPRQTNTIKVWI